MKKISENSSAQATLTPKSREYDPMERLKASQMEAIKAFNLMNDEQKQHYRDWIKNYFESQPFAQSGGGINDPENAARKNRASIKSEELDDQLKTVFGVDDAQLESFRELFVEAVKNQESRLRDGIANLLYQYSPTQIEQHHDVVDELDERIEQLRNAIEYVEDENLKLSEALKKKLSESYELNEVVVTALWNQSNSFDDLEHNLQQTSSRERIPKRYCFIDEQLEEINDDPAFAQQEDYISPSMKPYMRFLK